MKPSQHLWNKGQLTIFMVMAVVVLLLFVFVFVLNSRDNALKLDFTSESIQGYLDNCLRQTAEDALELLGKQGGRIQLQDYVPAPHHGITVWLKNGTLGAPTADDMESQLSWFIGNNIERCTNDFKDFNDKGWQVEAGEFSSSASINQQDVSFAANYPLTIRQQESSIVLAQLSASLPVRLQHIHSTAAQAAQLMQKNGKIDMTALDSSTLNATIFPYKDALIYQFVDEQSELKNKAYVFNIAVS